MQDGLRSINTNISFFLPDFQMNAPIKGLICAILLSTCQMLFAAPASSSLTQKLESKITYQSQGESIGVQLKKFSDMIGIYLDIDSSAEENLKLKTKKLVLMIFNISIFVKSKDGSVS